MFEVLSVVSEFFNCTTCCCCFLLQCAAACNDGSVQIWDHRRSFVNTAQICREGHAKGNDISSICYSYCGNRLLTRGLDDRMVLLDSRNIKKPLHVFNGLNNMFSMTDAIFSPSDKLILTGTSLERGTFLFFAHWVIFIYGRLFLLNWHNMN